MEGATTPHNTAPELLYLYRLMASFAAHHTLIRCVAKTDQSNHKYIKLSLTLRFGSAIAAKSPASAYAALNLSNVHAAPTLICVHHACSPFASAYASRFTHPSQRHYPQLAPPTPPTNTHTTLPRAIPQPYDCPNGTPISTHHLPLYTQYAHTNHTPNHAQSLPRSTPTFPAFITSLARAFSS